MHTSSLNLFLTTLSNESLIRIEQKLDEIVRDFQRGDRDASSVAHLDEDVPEAEEQWQQLKKELVDDGFTRQNIEAHKGGIKAHLRGMLDTQDISDRMIDEVQESINTLPNQLKDTPVEEHAQSMVEVPSIESNIPSLSAGGTATKLFFHHWVPPTDMEAGSSAAGTTAIDHSQMMFLDGSMAEMLGSSAFTLLRPVVQASLKRRASSPPITMPRHASNPASESPRSWTPSPGLHQRSSNEKSRKFSAFGCHRI